MVSQKEPLMPIRFIKSVFSGARQHISVLRRISDPLGEYASIGRPTEADIRRGNKMLSTIEEIERKSTDIRDSNLFCWLATAYENYCAWYIRGDERKPYLEKVASNYKKAIDIAPGNIEAKAELGRILIEKRLIRNLDMGIEHLEELKGANRLPDYLESILAKAHRQKGNIFLDENYDLTNLSVAPASFREERIKFRALIKKFKKEKDEENLKKALNQFYNLAVFAVLCYRSDDCYSGVTGRAYERAEKKARKYASNIDYNFKTHGYIKPCKFLSKNDWQNFVKVFGDTDKKFDPQIIIKQDT
jgi:hypothetical protein